MGWKLHLLVYLLIGGMIGWYIGSKFIEEFIEWFEYKWPIECYALWHGNKICQLENFLSFFKKIISL